MNRLSDREIVNQLQLRALKKHDPLLNWAADRMNELIGGGASLWRPSVGINHKGLLPLVHVNYP